MPDRITIRKPDDWHLHVRDGEMLKVVLPYTAAHFGRARPPVAVHICNGVAKRCVTSDGG